MHINQRSPKLVNILSPESQVEEKSRKGYAKQRADDIFYDGIHVTLLYRRQIDQLHIGQYFKLKLFIRYTSIKANIR